MALILGLNYIRPTFTCTLCQCQTLVHRSANIDPTKKIVPCNSNIVYIGPVLVRAVDDSWAFGLFWPPGPQWVKSVFGLAQHWSKIGLMSNMVQTLAGCKLMSTQCLATIKCRSDIILQVYGCSSLTRTKNI